MPRVQISFQEKLLASREFDGHFIITGHEKLFWQCFGDKEWNTDTSHNHTIETLPRAQRQITLLKTVNGYEIESILPEWILTIDGNVCAKGFYNTTKVFWGNVKLSYSDYTFNFYFSEGELAVPKKQQENKIPEPLYTKSNLEA